MKDIRIEKGDPSLAVNELVATYSTHRGFDQEAIIEALARHRLHPYRIERPGISPQARLEERLLALNFPKLSSAETEPVRAMAFALGVLASFQVHYLKSTADKAIAGDPRLVDLFAPIMLHRRILELRGIAVPKLSVADAQAQLDKMSKEQVLASPNGRATPRPWGSDSVGFAAAARALEISAFEHYRKAFEAIRKTTERILAKAKNAEVRTRYQDLARSMTELSRVVETAEAVFGLRQHKRAASGAKTQR